MTTQSSFESILSENPEDIYDKILKANKEICFQATNELETNFNSFLHSSIEDNFQPHISSISPNLNY